MLWQTLRKWEAKEEEGTAEQRAELLALKARAASLLRDFTTAEDLIAQAETLACKAPWIRLQRAHLLEEMDRLEEALEVANDACLLHSHPFYRAGVQTRAQLLQLLNRDEDAIELLRQCDAAIQNGPVTAQLFAVLCEHDRWAEAEAALERFCALSPLAEKNIKRWIVSQRARVSYRLGKRAEAAAQALTLEDPFHQSFGERLKSAPPNQERAQLDVSFVRQHFKTCAPATLAAIARFWGMATEQVKVAEAICYDGTPHWEQRDWAEKNGWLVREFRVTRESAMALLERGAPFAISVVDATSAHMVAAIGFDRARETLLLRDPSQPYVVEAPIEPFLKQNAAFGPHGMVLLPERERARIDGIDLPDVALQDHAHQFRLQLSRHDRAKALEALELIEAASAAGRLSWEARLELAYYDGNSTEQARCLDKLLEQFAGTPALILRRLSCLPEETRQERIAFLERACAEKEAHPALFIALARALTEDARCHARARLELKKAMKFRQMDSSAICALGDLCWNENKTAEGAELYRFAANVEGFREDLYRAWFVACRRTRHTEEALKHLRDRFERFGIRSGQPALTLAWAWHEMDQPSRARNVLTEGIRLRPNDGYLLLRAASLAARLGDNTEADRLLKASQGKVRENDWLRSCAEIAESQLDGAATLEHSRRLLSREPLALDVHHRIAHTLARREGAGSARAHLEKASLEHPHHYGLQRMCVEWSRGTGFEAYEFAVRKLLELEPGDAWAHRELAIALAQLKRTDEALGAANQAILIEPYNSYSHSVAGEVQRIGGNLPAARTAYRRAIELRVDNGEAIEQLLQCAGSDTERKCELQFVESELVRQVVSGDGLLTYMEVARPILDAEELLQNLRKAHAARPDLWHAWASLVAQLGHCGKLDEALSVAKEASERYSHLPRAWLDLALAHEWRGEIDNEIAAAERAFELNPAWTQSCVTLAKALERKGLFDKARETYDRALSHQERDAQLEGLRANLLWRQQNSEAALAGVERALRLAPTFAAAWHLLADWSAKIGQPERSLRMARALSEERPGEPGVWLYLARALYGTNHAAEQLAAINRAVTLDSRSVEAWDAKAEILAIAERFDEAVEACAQGIGACGSEIHVLQGRRAWIEARRNRRTEAVELMRAVLAENNSYVWGWNQLAIWLMEEGALGDASEALEHLARLRPHDAWVHRQLGFIRLKQKRLEEARKAFASALALNPTDVGAAHNLFQLQLEADDLPEAGDTVEVMRLHQPGSATTAVEILLYLRRNDRPRAAQLLGEICASSDPDAWAVNASADAFARAGLRRRALKIFKQALRKPSCHIQVGSAAIHLLMLENSIWAATRVFARLPKGEAQARAAAKLAIELAARNKKTALKWVLWRRRTVFSQNAEAWANVGIALLNCKEMKMAALWLGDWRQRPEVQPATLFNLCLALRHLDRRDEATEIAQHVAQTWKHREGASDLRLFIAVEEALKGSAEKAAAEIAHFVPRENVAYDVQMLAITKSIIRFRQAPPDKRPAVAASIQKDLDDIFAHWPISKSMRDVRMTFRRTGKLFCREGAGLRNFLWFAWIAFSQRFALALVPLVFAVFWALIRSRG